MDPILYDAAINGRFDTIESLEKYSTCTVDSNWTSPLEAVTWGQRNTILHVATIGGNEFFVEKILKKYPALLKKTNTEGQTALHIASRLGHLKVASTLLKSYAGEEGSDDVLTMKSPPLDGVDTELQEAVRHGHYDLVKLLLSKNPSLASVTNGVGESPLFMAVDRKFYDIARHILERYTGDPSFISGRNGMTVMHAAVIRLHYVPTRFRWKLQRNEEYCSIRRTCAIYFSQLWISCLNIPFWGFKEAFLLSTKEEDFAIEVLGKAEPEILGKQDYRGWVPLHYAAHIGNEKILRLLLQRKRSLAYITDNRGMSALHIAIENGRNAVASILIEMCPDVCELKDNRGHTALHVSVEAGLGNLVFNLLNRKCFNNLINEKDNKGNTALHLAALHNRYRILRTLAKDTRVDKGAINNDGKTVVDIITSSSKISHKRKAVITTTLKIKRLQSSLEKRVVYLEETLLKDQHTDNDDLMIENEIAQENKSEKTRRRNIIQNLANVNLLVATIIASITFAAAMAMPGGYDNSDGMAILRGKDSFRYFLVFDSLAFGCATASMCIHFLVAFTSKFMVETYSYSIKGVMLLTLLSIASTVIAFITGTNAVLKHGSGFSLSANIALISFIVPVSLFFVRIVNVLCRMLRLFINTSK